MKTLKNHWMVVAAAIVFSVAILVLGITVNPPRVAGQGATPSISPNVRYPSMVFTATAQTKTQAIGGVGSATISVSGTALTTVTWQIFASNDGGTNYYAIPQSLGTYTSNVLNATTGATNTTTAATNYYVNLSGYTNFKITTSGTFTATSVTITVTASGNRGIF